MPPSLRSVPAHAVSSEARGLSRSLSPTGVSAGPRLSDPSFPAPRLPVCCFEEEPPPLAAPGRPRASFPGTEAPRTPDTLRAELVPSSLPPAVPAGSRTVGPRCLRGRPTPAPCRPPRCPAAAVRPHHRESRCAPPGPQSGAGAAARHSACRPHDRRPGRTARPSRQPCASFRGVTVFCCRSLGFRFIFSIADFFHFLTLGHVMRCKAPEAAAAAHEAH